MGDGDQVDRQAWAALVQAILERDFGGNQRRLADAVSVDPRTVKRWLNQEHAVSEKAVRTAARRLERDPLDMLVRVGYYTYEEARRQRDHRMPTALGRLVWRAAAGLGLIDQDQLATLLDVSELVAADLLFEPMFEPPPDLVDKLVAKLGVRAADVADVIAATGESDERQSEPVLLEAGRMLDQRSPLSDADRDRIRKIVDIGIDPYREKMEQRKIS